MMYVGTPSHQRLVCFGRLAVTAVHVPVCFGFFLLSGWIPVPPLQGVTGPFVQADLV